jgi:Cu(I)/Ag(I) efflux system membrane protein CusA/SilA
MPVVFAPIFTLLYALFGPAVEAVVLILPMVYAMSGELILQYLM